jgi:hypothetical protein
MGYFFNSLDFAIRKIDTKLNGSSYEVYHFPSGIVLRTRKNSSNKITSFKLNRDWKIFARSRFNDTLHSVTVDVIFGEFSRITEYIEILNERSLPRDWLQYDSDKIYYKNDGEIFTISLDDVRSIAEIVDTRTEAPLD